jgi:Ca-activated chloride channel homolog
MGNARLPEVRHNWPALRRNCRRRSPGARVQLCLRGEPPRICPSATAMSNDRPDMNAELRGGFEPLRIVFVLVALLLGVIASARAEEAGSGQLQIVGTEGGRRSIASMDTDVQFHVSGLIAEVAVHQHFRNDGNAWLEGQYVLPLPTGAAVHTLKLHIGERVIVGEIREKQQARAEYAQAMAHGKKASLVEQTHGNLFRTAIANVAPGETVEVEIGYWQRVEYKEGQFSLSFPLTFTERYSMREGASESSVAPVEEPVPAVTRSDAPPKVSIAVELDAGLALERVDSPSHAIDIRQSGARINVTLQDQQFPGDRDFVLSWKPKAQAAPMAALFSERVGDDNYLLLMLMPQTQLKQSMPRELILVMDTSGSMEGASIRQARAALDQALLSLEPQDRFNVIEFNSVMHTLFDEAVPALPKDVQLARDWVAGLNAGGGTEMFPALQKALSGKAPEGFVRQVVFATDGAVEHEDGLLKLIESDLRQSRLFPVGIGSAPNAAFLTKAAQLGRGSEVVIRDLNEVAERMRSLIAKLDRPALRDLKLQWPSNAEVYPQQIPDLYMGEPLLVVARLPKLGGTLRTSGMLADSGWTQSLDLKNVGAASGVARLWARQKIEDLEDALRRGGNEGDLQPQILDIALSHHLVSRFTSLIAVDKTPVKPQAEPLQSVQIANATPAGQLGYAQTATPATLQLWLGVIALLLAVFLHRRTT